MEVSIKNADIALLALSEVAYVANLAGVNPAA